MNVNTVSTFLATGTVLIVAGLAALLILRLAAWKMTAAQSIFERGRSALRLPARHHREFHLGLSLFDPAHPRPRSR
jgi:hypothetical protein